MRTGARPAALVFLGPDVRQVVSDPSLTQPARLPAEIGRLEFKAFDAIGDLTLYGELLSLLSGLVLDQTLPGRRTTPDAAAHRHVVTVEDGGVHGGYGDSFARALRASGVATPVHQVALPQRYLPHGARGGLLASYALDGAGVAEAVRRRL